MTAKSRRSRSAPHRCNKYGELARKSWTEYTMFCVPGSMRRNAFNLPFPVTECRTSCVRRKHVRVHAPEDVRRVITTYDDDNSKVNDSLSGVRSSGNPETCRRVPKDRTERGWTPAYRVSSECYTREYLRTRPPLGPDGRPGRCSKSTTPGGDCFA